MHPHDAEAHGLAHDGFARVTSAAWRLHAQGRESATASSAARCSCRSTGATTTASSARIGDLVAPPTDPFSGQPEAKATPARSRRSRSPIAASRSARPLALPAGTWWARVALADGTGISVRDQRRADGAGTIARRDLCSAATVLTEYVDRRDVASIAPRLRRWPARRRAVRRARRRCAAWNGEATRSPTMRARAGAGRDRRHRRAGPVICACFGVGLAAIRDALASARPTNVAEIGTALRAGTKCGSCLPELRSIVHDRHARETRTPSERRPPRMEPLARLPVFFALDGKRAVVAGGTPAAAWKAELLSAAGADGRGLCGRAVRGDAGARGRAAARRDRHPPRAPGLSRLSRRRHRGRRLRRRRRGGAFRRRRARRGRAGQRHRQAGVLRLLVRRHRQPLAAGDRHLDRRRGAGVRPGDPRQARSADPARLRALGRGGAALAAARARLGLSFCGRRRFWQIFTAHAIAHPDAGPRHSRLSTRC